MSRIYTLFGFLLVLCIGMALVTAPQSQALSLTADSVASLYVAEPVTVTSLHVAAMPPAEVLTPPKLFSIVLGALPGLPPFDCGTPIPPCE